MKNLFTWFLLLMSFSSFSQDVKTFIPINAHKLLPLVREEALRLMPELPYQHYFGALIEHESCIGLKHSRCWSPTSELRSKRELGIGLAQITKAYNPDGSIRFDSLDDLRKRHHVELKEMSWETVKFRPDLQIRGLILMTRDNWKGFWQVPDLEARGHFSDAAYNGGKRGVDKERLQCGLTKGCDPKLWFGNVEKICLKSTKPLYSGRSACDINRHHVHDVFDNRMPKYEKFFKENSS